LLYSTTLSVAQTTQQCTQQQQD